MPDDTLVIVNPAGGGGRALRAEAIVANYLAARGRSVRMIRSRSSEDIREQAARGAASGYRYVVALGGDGAFHHLIEGIGGTEAVAGFFPAGSGNDMAYALGIPADPVRAAEAFLRSQPRSVDLIRASFSGGRIAHFVCAGGLGLDAEAAHLANTRFRAWPGTARYLAGALATFSRRRPFGIHAELDETTWAGRAIFVAIANASSYGSGVRIAPEARMDDGWLNAVLVGELTWRRLLEAVPIVLGSGDLRFEEVKRYRCKRVAIKTDRPALVHGDGELLGQSPVEFEILPGAVRIMMPRAHQSSS